MCSSGRIVFDETPHRKTPNDAQRKRQNVTGDVRRKALALKRVAPDCLNQETGPARRSPNDSTKVQIRLSKGKRKFDEETVSEKEIGAVGDDCVNDRFGIARALS